MQSSGRSWRLPWYWVQGASVQLHWCRPVPWGLRVFSLRCLSGPNQTARKAARTPAAARLQDRQRLLAGRETGSPIQEPFASRRKFQPRHDRWRHKPSPRIQDRFSARLRFRRTAAAGDGGKRVRQFKTDFRSRLWANRGPPHRLAVEPAPLDPPMPYIRSAQYPRHARRPARPATGSTRPPPAQSRRPP